MEELQQYDIIEITTKDSVRIIGSFHSMIDGEILILVPPTIQYILKTDVTNITRIQRKDQIDTSQIEAFFKYSSFVHKKKYKLKDILIITFEDSNTTEGSITEINHDCITLQLTDDSYLYINFNYKSIPLGITEIKRKQTHDLEDRTEDSTFVVPSYNIDESKCKYTLNIQIEAILQYLNFNQQYNGEIFAQRYKELMTLFPYGTPINIDQTNLKWIYPTTSASVSLLTIPKNKMFKQSLVKSLMCYEKSLLTNKDVAYSTVQEIYKSVLRVFDKKNLFVPTYSTYMLPNSVILKYIAKTASKEQEFNWATKIQHWIPYVTNENLPIDGYTVLPESSISFSKIYLPETPLLHKVHLNSISHYHLFNIQCEPSFTFKEISDYTNKIPSIDKLIHQVPTYYSFHEFVKHLEPYHIYANHISHSLYSKINKQIEKNIHSYVSKQEPSSSLYTALFKNEVYDKTYISVSELYQYALSLDSANAYILSSVNHQTTDLLDQPAKPQQEFVLKPPEPTCELNDDCDTEGVTKLKNFQLSSYHSSTVEQLNIINFSFLQKKLVYAKNKLLKYNNKLNELKSSIEQIDKLPYSYELFYEIMTYPFTKRYTSLLVFLTKYTTLDNDTQLYICNTSRIPIVPVIFKTLADTYLTNIDEYNTILYKYCKTSPQIYVEDGYYKEKHTGISLTPIERVHSYDELIRSDEIELDLKEYTSEYSLPQKYVENHIHIIWKTVTSSSVMPNLKMVDFINDMISEYTITEKSIEKVANIKAKYLLTLLIYVYIKYGIPCEKIVDEIGKNKSIVGIDLGLDIKPYSFLANVQKYASNITQLCALLYSKYKHTKQTTTKPKIHWGNFMPYIDSNHPVLVKIKSQIQKPPIHKINGEIHQNNHIFVDFDIPKQKYHHPSFQVYTQKINKYKLPSLELHINIENPVVMKPLELFSLTTEYNTKETLPNQQKRLILLQNTISELSNEMVNQILHKYPPLYMANFIKSILQFYAIRDDYTDLMDDFIPVTHEYVIAPNHYAIITKVVDTYYRDLLHHDKWGNLFEHRDSQVILEELKQPLTEDEKIILKYYLYQICGNVPKEVVPFINTRIKSEINIPDYDEIKKKMSVRQSVERKNFVSARSSLSSTEKILTGIIQTDITKTSYNITQFTSREEDALKSDIDLGNDGNE
jgi:hypothetical protein